MQLKYCIWHEEERIWIRRDTTEITILLSMGGTMDCKVLWQNYDCSFYATYIEGGMGTNAPGYEIVACSKCGAHENNGCSNLW